MFFPTENDSTGGKRLLIWGTIGMAGFCESQSLCHRTRGSPFQRVDAGTAPAEPLGTQSALNANFRLEFVEGPRGNSPACVDRSRTLLEPNALVIRFVSE